MIITCTKLTNTKHRPELSGWSDAKGYITVGNSYVVYAYRICKGYKWYLICDDNYGSVYNYPLYLPEVFFSVSDGSVSKYWLKTGAGLSTEAGFPEIINIPDFFMKLTDGDIQATDRFKAIKLIIDKENGYGKNIFIYRTMPPVNDDTRVINIPPGIKDKNDLINCIMNKLSFPFGELLSWDALAYFIGHIEWVKEKKVWINHEQLPPLQKNDLMQYIKCLSDACGPLNGHQHELTVYFPEYEENTIKRILKETIQKF